MSDPKRKIPYNYTSATDDQVIAHLFGSEILSGIRELEPLKDTGRSSRLLYRFMGDLFIIQRNAFLFQELVSHPVQRGRLFAEFRNDLEVIAAAARHPGVQPVLDACREALRDLNDQITSSHSHHLALRQHLKPVIGSDNLMTDPFNITAHATDATDWRRFFPVAVLRPDQESQVPDLVKQIRRLGYHIIPRGAGTGLTGGATPLTRDCIMINTEKLNRISDIQPLKMADGRTLHSITVEAGVITQDARDAAAAQGLIFATDPTSAWACTIGGNLAENAGGKTAVLFGTAIDNVLSYRITLPDGDCCTVERQDHPGRKILPEDRVVFGVTDASGRTLRTITLSGEDIRKPGLGKDVTNKTLNGLPGIQKEGCDGIITSARFILYPRFAVTRTCCMEFFGNDLSEAGQVITEVSAAFSGTDPALMALEHFDEEYIRAIGYKTKQPAGNRLKAVLLVDMVSSDAGKLEQGMAILSGILAPYETIGLSVARDAAEALRYWEDRKRLGAIAAHTHAFKLNEDIVLPMASLADFVRFVDQVNLAEKAHNQSRIIQEMVAYLDQAIPLADPQWLTDKVAHARDLASRLRRKLAIASRDALEAEIHARNFYDAVTESLRGYTLILSNLERIYRESRSRLIVVATHMHAGDGNVHVNIPVLSNDREMMARATGIADRIMAHAVSLNGVVSGEHGIGITKIKHLDPDVVARFTAYRDQVDPDRIMNPGKLSDPNIMDKVFTPSFNLLELEARILQHGSLSDLALSISRCVRCGKCKPQCPVFYPAGNLFFHPRNRNLAMGALIEALLYITQRTRSTGFKMLRSLEEIADHCTVCHRCHDKCPVHIDSGEISIEARGILKSMDFKHTPLSTRMTLAYLSEKRPLINGLVRPLLLAAGTRMQRGASAILSPIARTRFAGRFRPLQLLRTRVTRPDLWTLRHTVPLTRKNQALVLSPLGEDRAATVFYFPGCGSERMFSVISRATLFVLLSSGVRVVLPPPFLCCGYPHKVNARTRTFRRLFLENVIILTQIREMFDDLRFDACVVSCGTCMASLSELGVPGIFDCRIQDITGFVLNRSPDLQWPGSCLYHAPCHDSLGGSAPDLLTARGCRVIPVPHCCAEAGTLALSRPDISHILYNRKAAALTAVCSPGPVPVLTNCPACIQGLGRQPGLKPVHLAVALAAHTGGPDWEARLTDLIRDPRAVTF